MKISALLICSSIFLYQCTDHDAIGHVDEHESQSVNGYFIPSSDNGIAQSPINILSSEAAQAKHTVSINFDGKIDKVENLGHTVQLDFLSGNTITVDDKTYDFKQVHFHTPSEHLIDGVTYPMEMHMVSTLSNAVEEEPMEYLVFGFMIKMGEENRFINHFMDLIPEEENAINDVDLEFLLNKVKVDPESLTEIVNSAYHYSGSLTTPPYTETVEWYIVQEIYQASPEQIRMINEIEGDNARHVQSRNERAITN